jgi:hypothetical protein
VFPRLREKLDDEDICMLRRGKAKFSGGGCDCERCM